MSTNTETHNGTTRSSVTPARRVLMAAALLFALFATLLVGAQEARAADLGSAAHGATASCSNGACTVRLNWAETVALSQGRIPNINLGALTVPFRVLAYGHVLVAKGWVARGTCVAFTVNIRPWASQGMLGTPCR